MNFTQINAEVPDVAPPIPRKLVEYLIKVFPNRLPQDTEISDRALGALFGEQRVIAHLLGRLKEQEDTVLVQT